MSLPPMPAPSDTSGTLQSSTRRALLLAGIATVLLHFVPYAGIVTYPLRLLGTILHEGSHALMTLLTGGMVESIRLFPSGAGVTLSRGGFSPLIVSAGYLGATLYGAMLLALLRRGVSGRVLLWVTAGLVLFLTLAFVQPWINPFGFGWGIAIGVLLLAGGLRLGKSAAAWAAAFVGVQCLLNALFDLGTLFQLSVSPGAPDNDALILSRIIPLPPVVWASIWILLAAGLLWRLLLRPAPTTA